MASPSPPSGASSPQFSARHSRSVNHAARVLVVLSHQKEFNQIPDDHKSADDSLPVAPEVREAIDYMAAERIRRTQPAPGPQVGSRNRPSPPSNGAAGPSRLPYNPIVANGSQWTASGSRSARPPMAPGQRTGVYMPDNLLPQPSVRSRGPPVGSGRNKPLPQLPSGPAGPSPLDPVAHTPHPHRRGPLPFTATQADMDNVAALYKGYNKNKLNDSQVRALRLRNWEAGRVYAVHPLNPIYNLIPPERRMDPEFHPYVKLGGKEAKDMEKLMACFTKEEQEEMEKRTGRDRVKAIHARWLEAYCDGFTAVSVNAACRRCLQGGWKCYYEHPMYEKGSIVTTPRKSKSKRRATPACALCHVSKACCSSQKGKTDRELALMEADLERYHKGQISLGELFHRQKYPYGSTGPYNAEEAGKPMIDAILKEIKELSAPGAAVKRDDTPATATDVDHEEEQEFDELDDDEDDYMAGPSNQRQSRVKKVVKVAAKAVKKVTSKKGVKAPAKQAAVGTRAPKPPRLPRLSKGAASAFSDSSAPQTASAYDSPEPEEGMSIRDNTPMSAYLAAPSNMRGGTAEAEPSLSPEMSGRELEEASPAFGTPAIDTPSFGTPVDDAAPLPLVAPPSPGPIVAPPSPRRKRTAAEMQAEDSLSDEIQALQIRQMQDRDSEHQPATADMKGGVFRRSLKAIGDKFNILKRAQSAEPSDAEGDIAETSERPAKRFRALSDNVGGDAVRPSLMGVLHDLRESEEEHSQGQDPRYLSAGPSTAWGASRK